MCEAHQRAPMRQARRETQASPAMQGVLGVNFCKLTVRTLARRFGVDEEHLVERWSERAAIREYDGGMSREDAETSALADVRRWCNERI